MNAAPTARSVESKPGEAPVLEIVAASKRFGSVLALDGINFSVGRGEIVGLLGDNGAGKSTLIKCISGVHRLDSGKILIGGEDAGIRSPADARSAGIETVYQDLALFDNMTPSQNFYAGRELSGPTWLPKGLQFLQQRKMDRESAVLLRELKVTLPSLAAMVAMMSGGQRQAIAVARSTVFARRVVVLDEPTAALGLRESRQVLNLIETLRSQGNSVILITHNMEHVVELVDRAVVLRQGRKVGELVPTKDNIQQLVSMIIGA